MRRSLVYIPKPIDVLPAYILSHRSLINLTVLLSRKSFWEHGPKIGWILCLRVPNGRKEVLDRGQKRDRWELNGLLVTEVSVKSFRLRVFHMGASGWPTRKDSAPVRVAGSRLGPNRPWPRIVAPGRLEGTSFLHSARAGWPEDSSILHHRRVELSFL